MVEKWRQHPRLDIHERAATHSGSNNSTNPCLDYIGGRTTDHGGGGTTFKIGEISEIVDLWIIAAKFVVTVVIVSYSLYNSQVPTLPFRNTVAMLPHFRIFVVSLFFKSIQNSLFQRMI